MKPLIILLLVAIFACLLIAAIALSRGPDKEKYLRWALTIRVVLTLLLIGLLIVGAYTGYLRPHVPGFLAN